MATNKKQTRKLPAKRKIRSLKSVSEKPALLHKIAKVPNRGTLAKYVERTVYGKQTFEWFDFAIKNQINVLLESPTGAGKSMGVEAYAESRGYAYVSFPFSIGVDSTQMFGKLLPNKENGNWEWCDGIFTDVARHGYAVVELNEINYAREQDLAPLNPVLRERRLTLIDNDGEVIQIPNNVLFIATTNPNYAGTRELNASFRNRFGIQLTYDYDQEIEAKLIKSESLLEMANQIRVEPTVRTPVATNMLIEFEAIAKELGIQPAVASFINHFDAKKERSAIKLVLDTWGSTIESEIVTPTLKPDKSEFTELEEIDSDTNLDNYGVEGIDWIYDDDANVVNAKKTTK